jgi:hypothetical protein
MNENDMLKKDILDVLSKEISGGEIQYITVLCIQRQISVWREPFKQIKIKIMINSHPEWEKQNKHN